MQLENKEKNPKKQICATDSRNKDNTSLWLIDGPRDALKQHGDFGCDANELLVPELVLQIAEQFNEGDQSTPGMRTMYDEAFQKDASHHFTETIVLHFHKEVEEQRAEPVGMGVGISQMENHGAQEVVLSFNI